ncbi:hypothetical protein [Bergeyella sp. RCAD1439]|uniref:hypothetical protein n=1 Tax=Bergeyella anatis TaxID=3113737 RepID=UPI002E193530|nr:hypothetical protein [Bergeyella sp. RCAD1439]
MKTKLLSLLTFVAVQAFTQAQQFDWDNLSIPAGTIENALKYTQTVEGVTAVA